MSKRQEFWIKKGLTSDEIDGILRIEREKNKISRERKKINNLKNKELLQKIKNDLIGEKVEIKDYCVRTMLSISPSTDGIGFYYKFKTEFFDGSEKFSKDKLTDSLWHPFKEYSKESFLKSFKYF